MNSRIAINICDLDAINDRNAVFSPTAMLLRDFCTTSSPTCLPDPTRFDSAGVILDGPASQDPERLQAVVELLQTVIGPRKIKRRVRCYREGPRGGWSEIRTPTTKED